MSKKREWRKLLKKEQRKRRRQSAAKERAQQIAEEEKAQASNPQYQLWLQQQAEFEACKERCEQQMQQEAEEAWLRRDLLAQKHFKEILQRQAADAAAKEALQQQQLLEYEKKLQAERERQEQKAKRQAEATAAFERTMQQLEDYAENIEMHTPPALLQCVETRAMEGLCNFYERTNCCRFGATCVYNHKRPLLSRILLLQHIFNHPRLDSTQDDEYVGADAGLELSEKDLRLAYDEFFEDVVAELEKYGVITCIATVRNTVAYLRGHMFVEYENKRSALKAFMHLYGRYYAGKPLQIEFAHLDNWRSAVCGLSWFRKCPKAQHCNYLHLFKNPHHKYNVVVHAGESTKRAANTQDTPLLSWDDVNKQRRNGKEVWRWSESPELELKSTVIAEKQTEVLYKKSKTDKVSKKKRKKEHKKKSKHHKKDHKKKKVKIK